MINTELAAAFARIADLLEISGGEVFRVNSYRRVARTLKSHTADIRNAVLDGSVAKLPGVGKASAQKIAQYVETGQIDLLAELESALPAGLPKLLEIQSLGPKKIAVVHDRLHVGGIDDLKRVIASGELAELSGFGAQSVKKISEGLEFLERSGGRTPMGVAMPIAEALAVFVSALRGVKRVEIAGSLRRGSETVGDIDLLCECSDGERVVEAFVGQPGVKRVLASGSTKGSIIVAFGHDGEIQVDLRVVPAESFGAAWQYFTGSKEHNVRLREAATRKKLRLNEYGLYSGERSVAGKDEASIYDRLGLPFIPPELREDSGEFNLSETPVLVAVEDIRGDLHSHTTASDGKRTIEEMAAAAQARGYAYLAITDHSRSSTIANGLSIERLAAHIETVRAIDAKTKGIHLFTGCECDILSDGSLDYPDEVLAECDVVVASIHSAMGGSNSSATKRTLAAIENPFVSIIGHATGRILNRRPAMDVDIAQIVRAASANGTALEINSSWKRLDLKDVHARQAIDGGAMLAINTDAHDVDQFDQIRYGVPTARRAGAGRDSVLNTKTLQSLRTWLAQKRSSA